MIPDDLRSLFWDVNASTFDAAAYPEYTISRVLEFGDQNAIIWLKRTFTETQIVETLRNERRLSRKSANFWALIYRVPPGEIAALRTVG